MKNLKSIPKPALIAAVVALALLIAAAGICVGVYCAENYKADLMDKAKEIALNHAGLSASDVTFIKAELDYEDGVRVYEIEFWSGRTEYDYEINAQSGEVVSYDRDIENFAITTVGSIASTEPAETITSDKAKEIALNHVGLSASDVTFVKAELDYEDGVRVYEVEFLNGRTEYDYEINAESGEIVSYNREMD